MDRRFVRFLPIVARAAPTYSRAMKIPALLLCALILAGCDAGGLLVVTPTCDVSTTDDVNNCGAYGLVCEGEHASMDCDLSVCVVDQCEPGWHDCDREPANGCETSSSQCP